MTTARVLFIIFLFLSFVNPLQAMESKVLCPDLETMHQSAYLINDAAQVLDKYVAATGPFAIHTGDIGWFAVVFQIQANSVDEAINEGRLAMLNVRSIDSEYAANLGGTYLCKYDGRKIEVISNDDDWRR